MYKIKYYDINEDQIVEKEVFKVRKMRVFNSVRYQIHETNSTGVGSYYYIDEENIIYVLKLGN